MDQPETTAPEKDRRAEPRTLLEQYHSVQFSVKDLPHLYQFKIRDISSQGLCILVRQDSDILPYLDVGDELDMEYHKTSPTEPGRAFRTRISHLSRQNLGRYQGHCLIGLTVLDAMDNSREPKGASPAGSTPG